MSTTMAYPAIYVSSEGPDERRWRHVGVRMPPLIRMHIPSAELFRSVGA